MAAVNDIVGYKPYTDDPEVSGVTTGTVVKVHKDGTVDIALESTAGGTIQRHNVALDAGATLYNTYAAITAAAPSDTAYNATSWNANKDYPTKNAVRDMIETLKTDNTLV